MSGRTVTLPRPLPHQIPILESPARFKLLVCGRRWGKTTLGLIAAVTGHGAVGGKHFPGAIDGATIWWIAPSYGIANLIWRTAKDALEDAWTEKREVSHSLYLPGGGQLVVKSADHPDSLRGAGLDGVILDEAAFMAESTWRESIRPALADKQGWAMFLSTPCGKNYFYELYNRAQSLPDWEAWQQPTSTNPIIPPEELESARLAGEYQFRQEFLADFVTPGGNIFRKANFRYFKWDGEGYERMLLSTDHGERSIKLSDCSTFITIDLAASTKTWADYTAMAVIAVTKQQDLILIDMVRERMEPQYQIPQLRKLYEKWEPGYIAAESGQYQLSFLEAARLAGLPITKLRAEGDKYSRALTLIAMMEEHRVYFQADAPYLGAVEDELLAFTGEPNYRSHDDMVDTLTYGAKEIAKKFQGWGDAYNIRICIRCGEAYVKDPIERPCPKCGTKPDLDDD